MLSRADVKEKLLAEGQEGVGESPKEFAETIKADLARWSKVIEDTGIKAD
jgi:tripartite-type tricarboxylate transporter receptor subunit TctC